MTADEITAFARKIQNMRETVSDFKAEFAGASDADLRMMIDTQLKIADDANWRAECAETELDLRQLRAIAVGGISNG